MRQCPRCTYPLEALRHQGSELDHCRRCGGSFLEPGEAGATYGALAEPSAWQKLPGTTYLGTSRLPCPTGDDMAMEAYGIQYEKVGAIEVDVCPVCKGLWLDAREGKKLYQIALAARTTPPSAPSPEGVPKAPGVGSYIFQLLTAFPIEVWNPVRKKPVLTIALIVCMALLFLGELGILADDTEQAQRLLAFWGVVPRDIVRGQNLWSLVSYAFLHLGWMHIIGNMYFFWCFGDNVEDALGKSRFAGLYVLTAIAGALLYVAFNPGSSMPLVGASGAVSGIMGAYMVLFPKVKVWVVFFFVRFQLGVIWYLGLWIFIQLIGLWGGDQGVAWLAHLGGFAAGVVFAHMAKNRLQEAAQAV